MSSDPYRICDLVRRVGPVRAVEIWIENDWIISDRVEEIRDTTKLPCGFQLTDVHLEVDAEDMLLLCFLPETYQKVIALFDGEDDQ